MNRDSESLQRQLINWLLAVSGNANEHTLVDCEGIDEVENPLKETTTSKSSEPELGEKTQTFQLGEIPTVQERFQAVLKRRLQIQNQNHPPLFPWESQSVDYPESLEDASISLVPAWGWLAQGSKLMLPVALPDQVFGQLLEKCQALITSSLPLGVKLVQVVESFFPDDSQTINDLAGMVLRSAYRSADTLETMPNLQSDYSDLQSRQQMALSLLAAKQLLENLTISVSLTDPVVERQWLTSAGTLRFKVELQSLGQETKLTVQTELPAPGILQLRGNGSQAMAESSSSGCLSVELCCGQPHQTYTLSVESLELSEQPLLFVISPTI